MTLRGRVLHRYLFVGAILLASIASCSREQVSNPVVFPGAAGSAQARLVRANDDTALLSWLEPDGSDYVLKYAMIGSGRIGAATEVLRSDRMFVNWADFPSVTPITESVWFAHWLRRRPDSGAYDVATAISVDSGASWREAEQMNEDSAVAEHGFVAVFPWDNEIAAFWLDGRELANWSFDEPDALLGTSLRLARYAVDGSAQQRRVVDELVCDCCQPDVAMTPAGPLVAYRDRTPDEIRDVVVRRWDGGEWSEPIGVGNEGWHIEGCPVNGPAIAAQGDEVVVSWFTAANSAPRVRLARSTDGGRSFAPAIDVDSSGAYGQPGIVLDEDGRAVVSWWRRSDAGGIDLIVRAYNRSGVAEAELVAAHESVGQPIDVPQLLANDGRYWIAWTSFADDGSVRVAILDL